MTITYPVLTYGQGSRIDTNPRNIATPFGDGYQQVIPDGINNLPRTGVLEHPLLDNTTASTLLTFLRANSSGQIVTIVNWMEDPTGATTLNIRIKLWTHTLDGITQTYLVTYEEAFGL